MRFNRSLARFVALAPALVCWSSTAQADAQHPSRLKLAPICVNVRAHPWPRCITPRNDDERARAQIAAARRWLDRAQPLKAIAILAPPALRAAPQIDLGSQLLWLELRAQAHWQAAHRAEAVRDAEQLLARWSSLAALRWLRKLPPQAAATRQQRDIADAVAHARFLLAEDGRQRLLESLLPPPVPAHGASHQQRVQYATEQARPWQDARERVLAQLAQQYSQVDYLPGSSTRWRVAAWAQIGLMYQQHCALVRDIGILLREPLPPELAAIYSSGIMCGGLETSCDEYALRAFRACADDALRGRVVSPQASLCRRQLGALRPAEFVPLDEFMPALAK